MASITIRNLDNELKRRLRIQAAEHGCSMEEEARDILRERLSQAGRSQPKTGLDLFKEIRAAVEPYGGIELEPFPDQPVQEPPDFGGSK